MKRFTDTDKWKDPWFRKLTPSLKSLWLYLCDSCDNAGFWKKDFEAACFYVDIFDPLEALTAFNKEKVRIKDHGDHWEIVDFVSFQYGRLSPDCKPHRQIIDLINKYEIKGYGKGIERVQDNETNLLSDYSPCRLFCHSVRSLIGGVCHRKENKSTTKGLIMKTIPFFALFVLMLISNPLAFAKESVAEQMNAFHNNLLKQRRQKDL